MSFMPHPFPGPPPIPPSRATVKLALEGPDAETNGPFVRIQLPDTTGAQSLEILRHRALDLWQATHGSNTDLTDAKVFLTYRDGENDLCYVFSEEDLRCAIPPFPTPALKMFARVELPKVESCKKPPTSETFSSRPDSNDAVSFKDIPVHKVVESVVGVLSAANLALQNHVKNSHNQGTNTPPESVTAPSTATESSPPVASPAVAEEKSVEVPPERIFIHGRHTCDGCLTHPIIGDRFRSQTRVDHDLCSPCHQKYEGEDTFQVEELNRDRNMQDRWHRRFADKVDAALVATKKSSIQENACPPPKEAQDEAKPPLPAEERLFIHGRHTCDACLTTPIVGARFHAVNLSDYDLCANCHENYKDSEIQFEEEELDRDRPMQERWYRRFNKWNQKNQRQAARQQMRQAKREAKLAMRACGGPRGMKNMPPPFAPPNHHGVAPRQWNRHQRFAVVPAPTIVTPPPEQVDHALKEAIRRSMEDLKQQEEGETKPAATLDSQKKVQEEATEECAEKVAVNGEAQSDDEEEEFIIPPEAPVGAHPAMLISQDVVAETKGPDVVEKAAEKNEGEEDTKNKSEDSFSSDAEGNGDVAAALGETMDAIANAIDEMAAEFVRSQDDNASEQSAVMVNSTESTSVAKAGATIVSGEEEEEAEDEESDNGSNASWNLVASDEALARAAQVLGSALFESELSRGAANASHAATNEDVSMLDSEHSLPSTLPSVSGSVAQAQMDRWALQLRQLHELGFMNDTANVEIMERLEAANIGSGEEEEISVERVINELMKEW